MPAIVAIVARAPEGISAAVGALLSDLRYSFQELRRRPVFAATAVLSLALGIGATSAVFSVIYGVLINPYPYSGADRIMELHLTDNTGRYSYSGLNGPQVRQLRQAKAFENLVELESRFLTETGGDLPEHAKAYYFSGYGANHLGVPALLGRWLIYSDAPEDQDPQRVVVLTHEFWQRRFGGDPGVVGRTLQLDHQTYQVVGVMPPRFRWGTCDVYLPLKVTGDPTIYYRVSFKLRPGVTAAQADAELQPIFEQFAKQSPRRYPKQFRVDLISIADIWARPLGPLLYLLLGAVGLLLLVGCANVSILLLARGTQRQHELAVRAAVGATPSRIVRQLLTESLAIAIAGTSLSLPLAWKGLALITAWLPEGSFPGESEVAMNLPVLLFSVGLAFLTTLMFGVSPALQLSRPDIGRLMQGSMRRIVGSLHSRRAHNILVASQVALTILLLASAAAAGKGFLRLLNADLGYDPRNTMSVMIPIHQGAHVSWVDRSQYFEQLRARIASMPEVEGAAISTNATPPVNGYNLDTEIRGSQRGAASPRQLR